jgi:DNA polymerase
LTHLSIDIETFSSIDIKKSGLYKYVQSPDFEILLFAYSINFGTVQVVDLAQGEKMPDDVIYMLQDSNTVKHAYNAAFEWYCLSKYFNTPLYQWQCTMSHSLYCGYPIGLENVTTALGLSQDKRKMGVGKALIKTFCLPCEQKKSNGYRTRTLPHHEPEKWQLFKEYNRQDVIAEMAVLKKFENFPVPEQEQLNWRLDQIINTNGIMIDQQLVDGAIYCNDVITNELMIEAISISGLDNPKSVSQLKSYIEKEIGEELPDLTKNTVKELMKTTDNETVKRMLELRQELSKTSVKKYVAMKETVCADSRSRGLLQFYGANRTGRWCLAEGSQVLVKTMTGEIKEKPIEAVTIDDKVWDGDNWVSHEGVVFSGDKDVIEWDGIVATPDHIVYISDTVSMRLEDAKKRRLRLWKGNTPFTN